MDVVWIAPDYPQSRVIWAEDIKPRFKGLDGFRLNEQERTVTADGAGTLHIRSAEVIDGVRGIGSRLGGVIIDEAAHLDLEYAIRSVLRPALMDNQGWALFMSTTNAGPDGNHEKRLPSYFNVLCEQIRAGERNEEWVEFYGTAYDNSTLVTSEVDALVGEYPPDSPALKQEVFAELLRAGIGLALAEVSASAHIVDRFPIPDYWTHFGAFDWGFNHPYAFGWFTVDTDGNVYLVDTMWGRGEQPDRIAAKVKAAVPLERLRYIHAGHDCWADLKARGESVPTLAEQFQRAGWRRLEKANISRVSGLNNVRDYVHWQATQSEPERSPRFRMFDTEGNRRVLAQLQAMQVDPKKVEDALKVDADQSGRGGDDGYDMVRYGLASRPLRGKIGKEYESQESPHRDSNVTFRTVDGKPPRWIGPEGDQSESYADGYASQLPVGI